MKIDIKIIGALFLAVLLFFIFFSRTIYTYNMPTVSAVLPSNNKLSKSETATGLADWAEVQEVYAEVGGKVEDILVNEGDRVVKGQPLISFSYDADDMERALKELEVNRKKLTLDIESINMKLDKTTRSLTELSEEEYEKESVSDYELRQLAIRIDKLEEDYSKSKKLKQEEYEQSKLLFDVGAVTRQELDGLERELEKLEYEHSYELKSLNDQYTNLEESLADKEKKENESLEEKEKARSKSLLNYQYDIQSFQQDLKAKSLELSNMDLQEEKYKKALAEYDENMVITAPQDSTVITVSVKKGQYVNTHVLLISMGMGSEFTVECNISLENNFVTAGDICKLGNSSHTLEGNVKKITPVEGKKQVAVTIESEEVTAGETFELLFEKESADRYIVVPNGAVNKDSDGYYLYQIKRRNGILGKEFYAEKLRVYIGDSDNDYTVITKGVTFFEPVVLLSDKAFSVNETLRLENEGDFFASE